MKAYLFILGLCGQVYLSQAQSFSFHSNSPFGIQLMRPDSSGAAQQVLFYDFDSDGDLDLFLTGTDDLGDFENWETINYFIEMQENIGDSRNPQFGDRVTVFNDFPFPIGYFFPAIGDVNKDGEPDFVIFGEVNFFGNRTMLYLQSDGRSGAGFEVIRGDSMGLNNFVPESVFFPELADLDQDGDLDILMSGLDPAFAEEEGPDVPTYYYARNNDIRSAAATDFQGWYWNPYGLEPNPLAEVLTSGDIDNDGDVDLFGAALGIPQDSINLLYVHLNNPSNGKPSFSNTLQSPFGLPTSFGEDQFLFPNLEDIDGDGDLDLFVFQGTSNGIVLQYYENGLCMITTDEVSFTICEGEILDFEGQQFSEAGTYEIHTTGDDGCAHIITLFLTVEITPVVDIEESICNGESFLIGEEIFTEAGDYAVTLLTATGCDSIVLLHLEVIEVNTTVILQDETLVADLFGATYQWIDCNTGEDIPGATGQSYTVLETGDYAVRITDGSGCSSTSECVHVVITGTEEIEYSTLVTVHPNPADAFIYIRNTSLAQVSVITIMNVAGQSVVQENIPGRTSLDISSLQQGVYFVNLQLGNVQIVKKLIVI